MNWFRRHLITRGIRHRVERRVTGAMQKSSSFLFLFITAMMAVSSPVIAEPDGEVETSGYTSPPYLVPPQGSVILNGIQDADEACTATDPTDPEVDREISVSWLGPPQPYNGPPLPLHIAMTGAGGDYSGPYAFDFWPLFNPSWDWTAPDSSLLEKDNLTGAFNLMIRFECMNSPEFSPTNPSYLLDLIRNPLDVNYVYELLCTNLHTGTGDHNALAAIDRNDIDCTRVGLRGVSGGGFTSIMFLNSCFEDLSITRRLKAIATAVAGFFPLSDCPTGGARDRTYEFGRSVPLFMKVACSDQLVSFTDLIALQWESSPVPKYLYSRTGGHQEPSIESLIFGEDLMKDFMRYYLLGDTSVVGNLAAYPDRSALRPADVDTSYQYQSEIGTSLSGGLCRETFARWSTPEWNGNEGYLDHLRSRTESLSEEPTELPDTF